MKMRTPGVKYKIVWNSFKSRQFYMLLTILVVLIICTIYDYYSLNPINNDDKKSDDEGDTDYKPMQHVPLDELYKDMLDNDTDYSMEKDQYVKAQIIATPGCQIPLMMVHYKKHEKKSDLQVCGERLVFLNKIDTDRVRVLIKDDLWKRNETYDNYQCCLRFYEESENDDEYKFSSCMNFNSGDIFDINSDFMNVQCFGYDKQNESHIIYDDMYAFCKKKIYPKDNKKCHSKYNVLMLGMDSMSLPRFVQTMTRTVNFMKNNFWLGYRGYHKVDDDKFSNLMAMLTGQKFQVFSDKCLGQMDSCNDLMIWTAFKSLGYRTAYGEDNVSLNDTFSENFTMSIKPTDHYLKPLFKLAENTKKCEETPYQCSGKVTSGQQVLDYALDFVMTYRDDSFFGLFGMNSFSHDPSSRPEDFDKILENFLNRLFYTGALKNTFVIFFSDHGIRFGEDRLKVEGYYDDRMPILFILPPTTFKSRYPMRFNSMANNQLSLITPYDIHKTMLDIYQMSECKIRSSTILTTKKFNNHESIFNAIPENRTCHDVLIDDEFCSCHKVYPLDEHDSEGYRAAQFVVHHIQNKSSLVAPRPCTSCVDMNLENILRVHFYYDENKINLFYIIAVEMTPKEMIYEATVLKRDLELQIIGKVNLISGFENLGNCVNSDDYNDRIFCVCKNEC